MNNVKSYLKPIVISLIILIALITLFFFYTDLHEEREPPGSKPVCFLDLSNHDKPWVIFYASEKVNAQPGQS